MEQAVRHGDSSGKALGTGMSEKTATGTKAKGRMEGSSPGEAARRQWGRRMADCKQA